MNKFICYSKCGTCRKAQKWMQDNGIEFESRAIITQNPTKEELKIWIETSGLPINKFFNTSGQIYKEQNIKEKVKTASKDELIDLLASEGKLVKRPVLVNDNFILVGFKEEDWRSKLL